MAILESQLNTWSHQGSITQSSITDQAIRAALLASDSGYGDKSFEVFLQGSYGNNTNIYAESDVDIVMCLSSIYRYNTDSLSQTESQDYRFSVSPPTYSFDQFKAAVVLHLQRYFGVSAVTVGTKALKIKGGQGRRDADVVVCYEYRRYQSYSVFNTGDYVLGIIFSTSLGDVINYPKQHSANLTAQHQSSTNMLKPMARILKNMRSRMVEDGLLADGVAPSYYIEGLFYNVPLDEYVSTSFGNTFCNGVNWLSRTDSSKLVCANRQCFLLGNSNVQWNANHYSQFLKSLVAFWNRV